MHKSKNSDSYNHKIARNEYFFRAFFILIVALIYNLFIAIGISNPTMIWAWFILQTIAFSLVMAWPLLKTSKYVRILIGAALWGVNQYLFFILSPNQNKLNICGILFHLFFNPLDQDHIFSFFTFFLIGTVIGDIIHEAYLSKDGIKKKLTILKKLFFPSLVFGIPMILIGFYFLHPILFTENVLTMKIIIWWKIYVLGILVITISIMVYLEASNMFETKKNYKYLYYFSYYSLTFYLVHNLLYFLFLHRLNAINIWIFIFLTYVGLGFLMRFVYKKWGPVFSLKVQIGRLSSGVAKKIHYKK